MTTKFADRSETAHLLLEMGARASDIDKTGHTALQVMVTKMPAVVSKQLSNGVLANGKSITKMRLKNYNFLRPSWG